MSSIDLLGLGFYTEAFLNAYSLVDDLAQQIVSAGMGKKGLLGRQQKAMLMAIKEERLKHFLTSLLTLRDWTSLEIGNHDLFKRLMSVNVKRNKIMHGPVRLSRQEAIDGVDALLDVLAWLRGNPFGVLVEEFPLLMPAEADFKLIHKLSEKPLVPSATSEPGNAS